ncbi:MAG: HAD family hydrolase [Anaerolineae bacterium]|nr:HAD family hydrolase [Anaerolineae bacterium]MDW8099455.1 HAD family hydrolase [Anaerolineae bacterium]
MTDDWLEVLNPSASVGYVRHALFDFDGTISTIRQGWEEIMRPLMVEMICEGAEVSAERRAAIEAEVAEYVDRSTGILTIRQMEWLEEAVRRHRLTRQPRTAREYKAIYNERLLRPVRERLGRLMRGEVTADDLMIAGARRFLEALVTHGVILYLASGSDHVYVVEEAGALRIAPLFAGGIYGALDETEAHDKARIIQRILDEHGLRGPELLVVGDGPVEIREAKARGALALGVASDEIHRRGWNERKRQRLIRAGADLLIPDFTQADELIRLLLSRP